MLSEAKVHVYSDSGFGTLSWQIHEHPLSIEAWKQWFSKCDKFRRRTSWGRVNNFPRIENTAVASWVPKDDGRQQDWTWKVRRSSHHYVEVQRHRLERAENKETCISNSLEIKEYAKIFPEGHWSFLRTTNRRKVVRNAHLQNQTVCGTSLRTWWWFISDKVDTFLFRGTMRWHEDLWKAKEEDNYRCTSNVIRRQQSCCFPKYFRQSAQCLRSSVGLVRKTCSEDFRSFVFQYGWLDAEMHDESESRISPNIVSISTNAPSINVQVPGDLLQRQNKKKFE